MWDLNPHVRSSMVMPPPRCPLHACFIFRCCKTVGEKEKNPLSSSDTLTSLWKRPPPLPLKGHRAFYFAALVLISSRCPALPTLQLSSDPIPSHPSPCWTAWNAFCSSSLQAFAPAVPSAWKTLPSCLPCDWAELPLELSLKVRPGQAPWSSASRILLL